MFAVFVIGMTLVAGLNAAPKHGDMTGCKGSVNATKTLQPGDTTFATGPPGGNVDCVPRGTEYHVSKDGTLYRTNPFGLYGMTPDMKILDGVKYAYVGYDDTLWLINNDGKIMRMYYSDTTPQEIPDQPDGVKFTTVGPRTYDEGFAVTDSGDLYHYVGHKWIKDANAKNVFDVSIGNAGSWAYVDTNQKIFLWDFEQLTWTPYEKNGKDFDLYDIEHFVVIDSDNNVEKRVNGQWTKVDEKCTSVFVSEDFFYCITPEGKTKQISYF